MAQFKSDDSIIPAPQTSRLLNLPFELRGIILQFALSQERPVNLSNETYSLALSSSMHPIVTVSTQSTANKSEAIGISVLRTNRQLHREGINVLYGRPNQFFVEDSLSFCDLIKDRHLAKRLGCPIPSDISIDLPHPPLFLSPTAPLPLIRFLSIPLPFHERLESCLSYSPTGAAKRLATIRLMLEYCAKTIAQGLPNLEILKVRLTDPPVGSGSLSSTTHTPNYPATPGDSLKEPQPQRVSSFHPPPYYTFPHTLPTPTSSNHHISLALKRRIIVLDYHMLRRFASRIVFHHPNLFNGKIEYFHRSRSYLDVNRNKSSQPPMTTAITPFEPSITLDELCTDANLFNYESATFCVAIASEEYSAWFKSEEGNGVLERYFGYEELVRAEAMPRIERRR